MMMLPSGRSAQCLAMKAYYALLIGLTLLWDFRLVVCAGPEGAPLEERKPATRNGTLRASYGDGEAGNGSTSSNNRTLMRCVCDVRDCERVEGRDCPWGLTLDFCGCCLSCSRGIGEVCGGALGTCAIGLLCVGAERRAGEGICMGGEVAVGVGRDDVKVCLNPVKRHGCLFHGGNCVCENHTVCPGIEMFLFDTEESCRSRIAILMDRLEDEEGRSSSQQPQPMYKSKECSRVKCHKVEDCPPDSYRLPKSIHEDLDCCPPAQKCRCNPEQLCPKPECPTGWIEKLVLNSTGQPGSCCPLLECSPNQSDSSVCSYEGKEYEPGETWTNHEDCSKCSCSGSGIVTCQKIQCDIPKECRLARGSLDSCCPQCVGCITSGGRIYNNSDIWVEDDYCTLCVCVEGRIKCHSPMCRTTDCEHPIHIPGECCPRCEHEEEKRTCGAPPKCEEPCPNGFEEDSRGCPTCQCNKCPAPLEKDEDCPLTCPLGFDTDPGGCPVCSCRENHEEADDEDDDDDDDANEERSSIIERTTLVPAVNTTLKEEEQALRRPPLLMKDEEARRENGEKPRRCKSADGQSWRAEGEEWWEGCHRCKCKLGLEMCSLITCSPPACEHPVFYPQDCCPRCPDEKFEPPTHKNLEKEEGKPVRARLCNSSESESDPWKLSQCLTCTCDTDGVTLCTSPSCPPASCHNPRIPPSSCCFQCPPSSPSSLNFTSSPNDLKSFSLKKCFSDDSSTEYFHGDQWKVGPCQSCKCSDGKIDCFSSSESCPRLTCERPVLAKNQCCPICLDDEKKVETKMNCSMIGSNDTWSHGQSWTVDKCTRCVCLAPMVQCTKVVCSVSCKKTLIYHEDKCCPICPHNDEDKGTADSTKSSIQPHCALLIALLLLSISLLVIYSLKAVYLRRRRRRRLTEKCSSSSESSSTSEYCYFHKNRKNQSSSLTSSSQGEEDSPEKKLLCPPQV